MRGREVVVVIGEGGRGVFGFYNQAFFLLINF